MPRVLILIHSISLHPSTQPHCTDSTSSPCFNLEGKDSTKQSVIKCSFRWTAGAGAPLSSCDWKLHSSSEERHSGQLFTSVCWMIILRLFFRQSIIPVSSGWSPTHLFPACMRGRSSAANNWIPAGKHTLNRSFYSIWSTVFNLIETKWAKKCSVKYQKAPQGLYLISMEIYVFLQSRFLLGSHFLLCLIHLRGRAVLDRNLCVLFKLHRTHGKDVLSLTFKEKTAFVSNTQMAWAFPFFFTVSTHWSHSRHTVCVTQLPLSPACSVILTAGGLLQNCAACLIWNSHLPAEVFHCFRAARDNIVFQDNTGGHRATEQVAFTVFIWAKTAVGDQPLQNKSRTVRRSHYVLRTTTLSPKTV